MEKELIKLLQIEDELRKASNTTSLNIIISYEFYEKDICVFGKKHSGHIRINIPIEKVLNG